MDTCQHGPQQRLPIFVDALRLTHHANRLLAAAQTANVLPTLYRRGRISDRISGKVPPTLIGAFAVSISCLAGSALSFFGFKLRETVSATSFTFIGVVCKFATVLVNQLIWVHHGSSLSAFVLCVSIVLSTVYTAPRRVDDVKAAANTPISITEDDDASECDVDDHIVVVERLLTSTAQPLNDPAGRSRGHRPVQ